jgi:hypothetical protein
MAGTARTPGTGITGPGDGPRPGPRPRAASFSYTACVRCATPEQRLVGGIPRTGQGPSIRVDPQPSRRGAPKR